MARPCRSSAVSRQTRWYASPLIECFRKTDGLLDEFALVWVMRLRFPLHFFVFKQTASHLPFEANVERAFSVAGYLSDPCRHAEQAWRVGKAPQNYLQTKTICNRFGTNHRYPLPMVCAHCGHDHHTRHCPNFCKLCDVVGHGQKSANCLFHVCKKCNTVGHSARACKAPSSSNGWSVVSVSSRMTIVKAMRPWLLTAIGMPTMAMTNAINSTEQMTVRRQHE